MMKSPIQIAFRRKNALIGFLCKSMILEHLRLKMLACAQNNEILLNIPPHRTSYLMFWGELRDRRHGVVWSAVPYLFCRKAFCRLVVAIHPSTLRRRVDRKSTRLN